jgi:hypothetical protein
MKGKFKLPTDLITGRLWMISGAVKISWFCKKRSKTCQDFIQINSLNSYKNFLALAREKKFPLRSRQLNPLKLLLSVTTTLGCQSKANLANIHRQYKLLSAMTIYYKPFHNQIKKTQCHDFFKAFFTYVIQSWVLQSLKITSLSTGAAFPFSQIKLHDGCSFQVHDNLQQIYPGLFKKCFPAAVELHVTMDLLTGSIDYLH